MYVQKLFACLLLPCLLIFNTSDHCERDTYGVKQKKGKPTKLEVLYNEHPEMIYELFSDLNLNYPGLEQVKKQVNHKKWINACKTLLHYYRKKSKDHYRWLQKSDFSNIKSEVVTANNVLKNIFTFQGVTAQQPTWPDNGGLNWYNLGPRNDKEWGYFLNRQGYFNDLLDAYKHTGKSIYAQKFNNLVTDWILQNPAPRKLVWTETWRQLEVGLRLIASHWPRAFYGFQSAPEFTDVARILMLSSVPKQANYLMHYQYTVKHSNWSTMELNGLAAAALYWPEFKKAPEWIKHATKSMEQEMKLEVYPDGVQDELTSHYHEVALRNFEQFYDLNKKIGRKLPASMRRTIIKMYRYLAYTIRPNGYGLLNNDSDLDFNRDLIKKAANKYHHKDWKYITTNGKAGQKPNVGPSVFFPWAGQMIMRSGWDRQAKWTFFDVGPWGHAHQHNDKLHLSVAAFGHDWLVDGGRYHYIGDKWRLYFISSRAHNVILVNKKGERAYKQRASKPIKKDFSIQKGLDFCLGSYKNGYQSDRWKSRNRNDSLAAKFTRAVLFINNQYWVVVDHVRTQKPEDIEPLWHFAPNLAIEKKNNMIVATDSSGNSFQLVPSDPSKWNLRLIKGQKKPYIQGWYSKTYNSKVPNYCAKYYSVKSDTSETFAWLLYPSTKGVKKVSMKVLNAPPGSYRLQVKTPDDPETNITVRFYGKKEISLSSGMLLDGICAVVEQGKKPIVADGAIKNMNGKIIAKDSTKSTNVMDGKKLNR
jgi:hypothetical protein